MNKPHHDARHVYVTWPADLHLAVRYQCVERDLTLNEWIAEAARAHLARASEPEMKAETSE